MEKTIFHGWYSKKQKMMANMQVNIPRSYLVTPKVNTKQSISNIYRHIDGSEVEVTEVTRDKNSPTYFDDTIYVGPCTNWIRSIYK